MKKTLILCFALLATTFSFAQKQQASPAATAKGTIGGSDITLSYHQPAVKGRKIWGDLVPFDKVWRTGANNATTIEISKAVKIQGQTLAAGKYSVFSIPTASGEMTFIFNKQAEQWGAYKYDAKDDVLRVKTTTKKVEKLTESMTFAVKEKAIVFNWEYLEASLSVE